MRTYGNIYGDSKRTLEGETRETRVSQPDEASDSHHIPSLMYTHDWLFSRHGGHRCDVCNRWKFVLAPPQASFQYQLGKAHGCAIKRADYRPFDILTLNAHMPQLRLTVRLYTSFKVHFYCNFSKSESVKIR